MSHTSAKIVKINPVIVKMTLEILKLMEPCKIFITLWVTFLEKNWTLLHVVILNMFSRYAITAGMSV